MLPCRRLCSLLGLAALLLGSPALAQSPPRVVATVLPVQSLTAAVMEGVGTPHLLIRGGGSPHSYALRPSDVRALAEADVVIWIGEELETFLAGALGSLAGEADLVTLFDAPGMVHLPVREGGAWEDHEHEGRDDGDGGHAPAAGRDEGDEHEDDPHLWLSTGNAIAIVNAVERALSAADPGHAQIYRDNATRTRQRLAALADDLDAELAGVRERPYVVFHDAYQYFERQFGLSAVGSVTFSPERKPGARRLSELRRKIVEANAVCVFSEPQFEPQLVGALIEDTPARSAVLDPLGVALTPGPEAYFEVMRGLAGALVECLGQ